MSQQTPDKHLRLLERFADLIVFPRTDDTSKYANQIRSAFADLSVLQLEAAPPTVAEQVSRAKAELAALPDEVRRSIQLEGLDTSPMSTIDATEARRLAILECAKMVNGRLAGREEGTDLWLEVIKITNMLARHANSDYRAQPSAIAPTNPLWSYIDRLEVYGTPEHPMGVSLAVTGCAGRYETARSAIEAAMLESKQIAVSDGGGAHPNQVDDPNLPESGNGQN